MTWHTRSVLLISALLSAGFVAFMGSSFSLGVEPERFNVMTFLRWVGLGAAVSAPLWVPASIPSRYARTLLITRFVSAAFLLVPTYFFGGIVVHNVKRSLTGLGATPSAFVQGLVVTVACVTGLVLLLWPLVRGHALKTGS